MRKLKSRLQQEKKNNSSAVYSIWNPVKKSVWTFPLSAVLFGASFIMLIFSLRNVMYCKQAEQRLFQAQIKSQKDSQGLPVRLKIPSISVDTEIEYTSINSKGEMDVPSNSANVGLFKLGPRPGDMGSAVIAGHLNDVNGAPGVFADLNKVNVGDKLYVEDNKGTSIVFIVREIRNYDSKYADEVFTRNDNAYLNLITCDGVWDEVKKSYSERLVVFTDIVY